MALTQIDFDETEEKVIQRISKEFNLNKPKAIKKIIEEFVRYEKINKTNK